MLSYSKYKTTPFLYTFFIVVAIGFVTLISCNNGSKEGTSEVQEKDTMEITQGVVTYSISYPTLDPKEVSPFFPKEIKLVFKDNLSSYVIKSGLGTVQIVRLLNFDDQEFISLLIDTWGKNYASKDSEEEIKDKETSDFYEYTFTDETAVYDGLTCKKAVVRNTKTDEPFEIYYAPTIKINNWNSPYIGLKNILIKYPFHENGMDMMLEAKKIEPREIDSSFFNVKGEFNWVSKTQFNEHLKSLQKK